MKHLFVLILAAAASLSAGANIMSRTDTPECQRWVDSVYNSLTPRERVAQLVFPKAVPTQGDVSKATLRRLVEKNAVGGLLFTAGSLEQYIEMTNYAQSIAKVPLLMTFDGEWGLSMRIAHTPKFPCNMALGAIADTALLGDYGREMARECRLTGIQVNFAPVVDVNSNPRNPVIGYRSFGEDPARVAALGTAYSRGLEQGGVQAVAKHFPGHGDTSTDSHKEQTVVNHTAEVLRDVDLVPFRDFIDNGCSGIMVGHIAVPAVDPSGLPATLSKRLNEKLLRDELGFRGLIYTDALGMQGAQVDGHNPALSALRAGSDVLLSSLTPVDDIDVILRAMQSGKLAPSVVEDHCRRILAYKYALGLDKRPAPLTIEGLSELINSPEARAINDALARACITVLRNDGDILPVKSLAKNRIALVNIGDAANNDFADVCSRYTHIDTYSTNGEAFSASTLAKIKDHDQVIAVVYNDNTAARHAFAQLGDMPDLTAVFMVNAYKMNKFRSALPSAQALMIAYDNLPETRRAAAQALFGGIEVSGTLPVNLPAVAPMGTGIHLPKTRLGYAEPVARGFNPAVTDSIDAIVSQAIAHGAFPGCQVLVARGGDVVFEKAYGTTGFGSQPVDLTTIYDLASVSKATGTLPGVMKAYDLGLIDLDAPAAEVIPPLAAAGKTFTPRQMLYHESGMPASINVYNVMMDTATFSGKLFTARKDADHTVRVADKTWGHKDAQVRGDIVSAKKSEATPVQAARDMWVGQAAYDTITARICEMPLRKNNDYNYSCLNFCLLMDMEQRLTGIPHQEWVADSVFAPIGASDIGYRPSERFELSRIAPTEVDPYLRRQHVHGFVHDETAAMLGGVSGNAGLFASAGDLAKLCQTWLNGGTYGDARIWSPETVKLFTTAKSPTCRRGLGFDKPDCERPDYSPTCPEASPETYGHLGFTGTVFWVDPSRDLIFIFLNNRVCPTRENAAFARANIRPALYGTILRNMD